MLFSWLHDKSKHCTRLIPQHMVHASCWNSPAAQTQCPCSVSISHSPRLRWPGATEESRQEVFRMMTQMTQMTLQARSKWQVHLMLSCWCCCADRGDLFLFHAMRKHWAAFLYHHERGNFHSQATRPESQQNPQPLLPDRFSGLAWLLIVYVRWASVTFLD